MKQRRMSRWGDGFHGERLPEYRIVVTERTRHGLAKRHTFVLVADTWDEPGGPHWRRAASTKTLYPDKHADDRAASQ